MFITISSCLRLLGADMAKSFVSFWPEKNGGKNLKCVQKIISGACCLRSVSAHSVCLGRSTTSSAGEGVFFFVFSLVLLLSGGIDKRWKDVFCCLQPIPQLLVVVCYVCLLGSLDHLVCGACVQSQISHSAQSGAGPRAAHNQRETSCWLAKQRNDRLVILRTWSWSRRDSERQALSCWDFCLGETCDSKVFDCSYGCTRWRPAYVLGAGPKWPFQTLEIVISQPRPSKLFI